MDEITKAGNPEREGERLTQRFVSSHECAYEADMKYKSHCEILEVGRNKIYQLL